MWKFVQIHDIISVIEPGTFIHRSISTKNKDWTKFKYHYTLHTKTPYCLVRVGRFIPELHTAKPGTRLGIVAAIEHFETLNDSTIGFEVTRIAGRARSIIMRPVPGSKQQYFDWVQGLAGFPGPIPKRLEFEWPFNPKDPLRYRYHADTDNTTGSVTRNVLPKCT